MHAWAKTPSKIYSLIDSARDYSNSARGRGSSQNGAMVNDGGMWCASAASRAGLMYSVGRNGPSTSSWTPHFRMAIQKATYSPHRATLRTRIQF